MRLTVIVSLIAIKLSGPAMLGGQLPTEIVHNTDGECPVHFVSSFMYILGKN